MVDHHVVGLHVPVHDPHTVTVVQSLREQTQRIQHCSQSMTIICIIIIIIILITAHEAKKETTSTLVFFPSNQHSKKLKDIQFTLDQNRALPLTVIFIIE